MRLWVFCNKHKLIKDNKSIWLSDSKLHCLVTIDETFMGISCFQVGLKTLMNPISLDSGNKWLLEFEVLSDAASRFLHLFVDTTVNDIPVSYIDIDRLPLSSLRAEYSIEYKGVYDKTVFWGVTPKTYPNYFGTIQKPIMVSGYGRVGEEDLIVHPESLQSDCGATRVNEDWTIEEALDCVNANVNFNILRMAADKNISVDNFWKVKVHDIIPKQALGEEE